MAATLHDFLQPQVILDVVSRIRPSQGKLGQLFGFHATPRDPGAGATPLRGPNTTTTPTRYGTYRIFDYTRSTIKGRAPGTGPATVAANPIGQVPYACARFHEKIRFSAEDLQNLSPIAGPQTTLDSGGKQYLTMQLEHLARRAHNGIEAVTAGMIRGLWYLKPDGDDYTVTFTQPANGITIDHQQPAGNRGQLDMLGGGDIITASWATPDTPIVNHLSSIYDAAVQLHGYAIEEAVTTPKVWAAIVNNTQVRNIAGSANPPFRQFDLETGKSNDGQQNTSWYGVLSAFPFLRWHIIADRLTIDGTLTSIVPENTVVFFPKVSPLWVDLLHYGEFISERVGDPMVKREGLYIWSEWTTQPTSVEIVSLMNIMPRLKVPAAIVTGTVIFS